MVVTLPGFDHIARVADSAAATITPPGTPSASSVASSAVPLVPAHHQRAQLPYRLAPPHQIYRHSHDMPRQPSPGDAGYRVQKKLRKSPTYPPGHTRNNRKYTAEQVDFINYLHVDKKLNWSEVVPAYVRQFPEEGSRTTSGLQGSYYRGNLQVPVTDQYGDLVFSEDGTLQVRQCKVRDQHGNKIGLLDRYPYRAVNYRWLDPEDRRRIWGRGEFFCLFWLFAWCLGI